MGQVKLSVCASSIISRLVIAAAIPLSVGGIAHAAVASIYGGSDGLCGYPTASGERLNCAAMTAAHRISPFGTRVVVYHSGCVTVRINDRGPWVRGKQIDLSPAAALAIGPNRTDTSLFRLDTNNDNRGVSAAACV